MIKVFSGQWRGIGQQGDDQIHYALLDFKFREILSEFHGARLAVFMAIALHSDENGRSFPSLKLMEKETKYTRPTIVQAIKELEALKIDGQRVLMVVRNKDENGKVLGVNHYQIFPTQAELTGKVQPEKDTQLNNLTTQEPTQLNNLTRVVKKSYHPLVKKSNPKNNHSKNNQEEELNTYNGACAVVSAPFSSEPSPSEPLETKDPDDLITGPNAEYRKRIRDAQNRGIQREINKQAAGLPTLDFDGYSEWTHPFLEKFCTLSGIPLPKSKSKDGKDWKLSADTILGMPGFSLDIVDEIFADRQEGKLIYNIYRPGSIIKEVRRRIGERVISEAKKEQEKPIFTPIEELHMTPEEEKYYWEAYQECVEGNIKQHDDVDPNWYAEMALKIKRSKDAKRQRLTGNGQLPVAA